VSLPVPDPSGERAARALAAALALEAAGRLREAEAAAAALLRERPAHPGASSLAARLAMQRGDAARAVAWLEAAQRAHPDDRQVPMDLAIVQASTGHPRAAVSTLEALCAREPDAHEAWLLLARLREAVGDVDGSRWACYEAVTRARLAGYWIDEASTPEALQPLVFAAFERLERERRALYFSAYADLRARHGDAAVRRIDRALQGFLKDFDATPADPRQRPRFLFVPDLAHQPYHDPMLQPWAPALQAAFPQVREEALRVIAEDSGLEDFLPASPGGQVGDHLAGHGVAPVWEAFFFYRHGRRYDEHHQRCPRTSAVLESIELCRIADQSPEICFSVLRPGTHILPHHGVTNLRLVMHLPLLVPPDCALNVVDAGAHAWQEGRLVMFDDTYRHEAWNRSTTSRVILLMDCWNPQLTAVEREAGRRLIETITRLGMARRGTRAGAELG
jgi:aspartate beta-hydroxylase